jgi:DNA-binding transcriptional LysR family regulator
MMMTLRDVLMPVNLRPGTHFHHSCFVIHFITVVNLSSVDLNLFLVLHTVLQEKSATLAATRLHVTQSAISNALARLRDLLGDPLFVREGRGLVPTPRAAELAPIVAAMVRQASTALETGRGFDAATTERTFTLCLADSHQGHDGPLIAQAVARRMPRARLRIVSPDVLVATDGLATGSVDAAFFPQFPLPAGLHAQVLFDEVGMLVVRRDHPTVKREISRAQFNTLRHIDVQVALGRTGAGHEVAERHWKQQGLHRDVFLAVPSFVAAAMATVHTDCIAALPDRVATLFARLLPLKIVRAAFPMPTLATQLVWHERTHADAGARFFRELIGTAVGAPRVDRRKRVG